MRAKGVKDTAAIERDEAEDFLRRVRHRELRAALITTSMMGAPPHLPVALIVCIAYQDKWTRVRVCVDSSDVSLG